jgi:hypothetical protein
MFPARVTACSVFSISGIILKVSVEGSQGHNALDIFVFVPETDLRFFSYP